MRILSILVFLHCLSALTGQTVIVFSDTLSYHLTKRADTVDIDHSFVTPYPNTLEVDLDCDSVHDIRINCYTTPSPMFPPAHNIEIENLVGADLEMLNGGWLLQAFRAGDTIHVDSTEGWESVNAYRILYFHVVGGASWAGVSGTDSASVNDMYVLFRKQKQGGYAYGWLHYSGFSWPAHFYLHGTAFDKDYCAVSSTSILTQESGIRIYPTPCSDRLSIAMPDIYQRPAQWRIYNAKHQSIAGGDIAERITEIDVSKFMGNDGVFFIQVIENDRVLKSQLLMRVR